MVLGSQWISLDPSGIMPSSPGTTGAKAGWRPSLVGWRPLLLGARTLLGAPGIATRGKEATRLEAISRVLTSTYLPRLPDS